MTKDYKKKAERLIDKHGVEAIRQDMANGGTARVGGTLALREAVREALDQHDKKTVGLKVAGGVIGSIIGGIAGALAGKILG